MAKQKLCWLFMVVFLVLLPQGVLAAPAKITNLTATKDLQIKLTWSAPDNGGGDACGSYLVKYSTTGDIDTEGKFTGGTTYYQMWTPQDPGATEIKVITGLSPRTTHWFSIKASSDTVWSVISDTGTNYAISGSFVDAEAGLTGVSVCSLAWGDYDNDGDLDLALAGLSDSGRISKIYRNDNGSFTDIGAGLTGVSYCSLGWGDYDNDGDLDLALAGGSPGVISKIYRNDNGSFSDIGAGLTGVEWCSLGWGDYDNDGDLDLALAGDTRSGYISKIYRNDNGSFSDIGAGLTGVYICSLGWGDYDNDGDLDLALAGLSDSERISKIYRNDNGSFTDIGAGLTGVYAPSLAWGDYDNDGDLDLALAGNNTSGRISKIYGNDSGSFSDIGAGLTGVEWCSLGWGDYDNDGDLDLALAGDTGSGYISKIYRNDNGSFSDIGAGLTGVQRCSLGWGDYDNDGDLDLALAGNSGSGYISKIYKSLEADFNNINSIPNAPSSGFSSNYNSSAGRLELRWDKGSDTKTTQNGLYYDIRIATESITDSLEKWIVSPSTGAGRTPFLGNYPHGFVSPAGPQAGLNIKVAEGATYYWQVRSIDTGLKCGNWSTPQQLAYVPLIPPAGVTNLSALAGWRKVSLTWTAPGDNGNSGDIIGGEYEIRCSTVSAISNEIDWESTPTGYPYRICWSTNTSPGNSENRVITGLTGGTTYWFAIKTRDENPGNWSALDTGPEPRAVPFNNPPNPFSLTTPLDKEIVTTLTPTFDWQDATDPDESYGDSLTYTIWYSTDSSFSVKISSSNLTTSSYTVTESLTEDSTYWWKVKAVDIEGKERWSNQTWEIRVNAGDQPPNAFNLTSPADGAIVTTLTPSFDWEDTTDPDPADLVTYEIQYSSSSDFTVYSSSSGLSISTYTVTTDLNEDTTYWWKVKATGTSGAYTWSSSTWTIRINATDEAPAAFDLVSPTNGQEVTITRPTFDWEDTTDPDPGDTVSYTLYYSTYSNYASTTTVKNLSVSEYTPESSLKDNTTYYWKVEAKGSGGLSRMSTQEDWWFFIKNVTPPAKISNVSAIDNPGDTGGQILVSWTKGSESDIAGYLVYYAYTQFTSTAQATYFSGSPISNVDASSCTVTGLTVDIQEYYFAVAAIDDAGNIDSSVDCTDKPVWAVNNKFGENEDYTVSSGYDHKIKVESPQGTNKGIYIDIAEPGADKTEIINTADTKATSDPKIVSTTIEELADTSTQFESSSGLENEVTIYISYPESISGDEDSLRIFLLDEANKKWIIVPGKQEVDRSANTVSARVSHFSIYRIFNAVIAAPDLSNVIVYPNPFKPNDGNARTGTWSQGIIFGNLTSEATIKIYNIAGELVRELDKLPAEGGEKVWDSNNKKGKKLASGVYIYLITNPQGNKKLGKLAVIK